MSESSCKKLRVGALSCALLACVFIILLACPGFPADKKSTVAVKDKVKADAKIERSPKVIIPEGSEMLNDRYRWFFEGRRGPDGFIPVNARYNAIKQEEENLKRGLLKAAPEAIPGNYWTAVGPAPLGSYSGRVSAMAAVDANTIYAGGAQGGIWKTTDAGATWTALTDQRESLATGSMALAPTDNNIIYVGTGESNHSCDSLFWRWRFEIYGCGRFMDIAG